MLVDNVCTIQALFVTKPLHYTVARPLSSTAELLVTTAVQIIYLVDFT